MGTLPVPPDQLHLPRAARQFPFRWANAAEREAVRRDGGLAIQSVDAFITKLLRDLGGPTLSRTDREDLEQEIRTRLWSHALGKFDNWRQPRVRLSTYLIACVWNHTRDLMRRRRRQQKVRQRSLAGLDLFARDTLDDRAVEALAEILLHDPSPLGRHAHAILSKPNDVEDATLAAVLGISRTGLARARFDAREKAIKLLDAA